MRTDNILNTDSKFRLLLVFFLFALSMSSKALSADLFNGQQIYNQHCQACHGVDGLSIHALAPNFQRGERMMAADLELMQSIKAGKGAMPAFEAVIREKEMLDVIAYIRTLAR